MAKYSRIGLIRVLTTSDQVLLEAHGRLIEEAFPSLKVCSRCIPGHPQGVYDEHTYSTAVPHVVDLAKQFEADGMEAVVVSCAGDPGVEEARNEVKVPVIGAGEATALLAVGLGAKVGVLGITEDVPEKMKKVLGSSMAGYLRPKGVHTTLDLGTPEGRAAVLSSAMELKEKGVGAIALACTGMSTIRIVKDLCRATRLPVVDPVLAEGMFAYYAVRLARWEE